MLRIQRCKDHALYGTVLSGRHWISHALVNLEIFPTDQPGGVFRTEPLEISWRPNGACLHGCFDQVARSPMQEIVEKGPSRWRGRHRVPEVSVHSINEDFGGGGLPSVSVSFCTCARVRPHAGEGRRGRRWMKTYYKNS